MRPEWEVFAVSWSCFENEAKIYWGFPGRPYPAGPIFESMPLSPLSCTLRTFSSWVTYTLWALPLEPCRSWCSSSDFPSWIVKPFGVIAEAPCLAWTGSSWCFSFWWGSYSYCSLSHPIIHRIISWEILIYRVLIFHWVAQLGAIFQA